MFIDQHTLSKKFRNYTVEPEVRFIWDSSCNSIRQ